MIFCPASFPALWSRSCGRLFTMQITAPFELAAAHAGAESSIQLWLDNPDIVIGSISVVLIWQYVGMNVVIFMASLQNLPQEVLESAAIDGANGLQRTFYIVMPLMKGTVRVVVLFCISGNMKIFEQIYNMTRGGRGQPRR